MRHQDRGAQRLDHLHDRALCAAEEQWSGLWSPA